MGQRNYELLNKAPSYIFWNSMWNSSYSFKNYLYLDFFFKQLISSVFFFNNSSLFIKNLKKQNSIYIYNTLSFSDENNFLNLEKNLDFLNPYLSKIWLLSYKNWIFITFFIFYPKGKVASEDLSNLEDLNIDFFFFSRFNSLKKKNIFSVNNF